MELDPSTIVSVLVSTFVVEPEPGAIDMVSEAAAPAWGWTRRPAVRAAAVATTPAARRRRTTKFMGLPVRCDGGRSVVRSAVVLIT